MSAMPKVGDGSIDGLHLLTNDQHLIVEVVELLIKSSFNMFESLPYALLHAPMLPSGNVLFISIKDRSIFITWRIHSCSRAASSNHDGTRPSERKTVQRGKDEENYLDLPWMIGLDE